MNHDARKGYNVLRCKFLEIITDVYEYLEEKKISINPFLVYLSLSEDKVNELSSWKDVMLELKQNHAVDFLNYHLLVELIHLNFEKNEAVYAFDEGLNEYATEVEKYKSETLILDFLDICIEHRPEDLKAAQGCRLFKALSGDLDKMTLADFSNIRGYDANEFRLHHYML